MFLTLKKIFNRNRAIFFIVGLVVVGVLGIVSLFNLSNRHYIERFAQSSVVTARDTFSRIKNENLNMLSAILETMRMNREIQSLFERRDRDGLYRFCRPLFDILHTQNRITHWYFIRPEPDGTCFLRVHNPDVRDDRITRVTYNKSVKTGKGASGIELGKTAYALRSVLPFIIEDRVVGYIELGVELEDLLHKLKKLTGCEYSLIVEKQFVDREKWRSVKRIKGERDNWDDLEEKLVITSTTPSTWMLEYLGKEKHVPDEGLVLQEIHLGDAHYVRGTFPLYDAAGLNAGEIFVVKDVTLHFGAIERQKFLIIVVLVLFMGVLTFFMIFFHKRAEKELRRYRSRLEDIIEERTRELQVQFNARSEAERKEAEAAKLAEQSARLASIGVMAAGISHEINQPLNAIKVTADSILYQNQKEPGDIPAALIGRVDTISRSANRIAEIIRHMRAYWTFPEYPKHSLIDLNRVVDSAISLVRQQLKAHRIECQISAGREKIPIRGNLIHFEQIIINIVSNAIQSLDATGKKGKKIQITSSVTAGQAVLTLADNGRGLKSENVDRLFDPFYSTKLDQGGMGLGLAIVKHYLDKYGGTIEAANNAEGGATFTIRVPVVDKKEKGKGK